MISYKQFAKSISKHVAAVMSSTGSYISREETKDVYFDEIARAAKAYEGPFRNPVIMLHGFLGASLVDKSTGENLWGDFDVRDALSISNDKMVKLAHHMPRDCAKCSVVNNIEADSILEEIDISMMGVRLKRPAYKGMVDILVRGGYQPSHQKLQANKNFHNLFLFAYDWRCDLPKTAAKLAAFIKEKKAYIQGEYERLYGLKDYDVKFDIVAHSMGGLVSRYFLRYGDQDLPEDGSLPELNWAGTEDVERLVMVGTPNAGYLDAFVELLDGAPIQPYPPVALGTLPSYYQMLPARETESVVLRERSKTHSVDIFDPEVWKKMKWGLMADDSDDILKLLLPEITSASERRETAFRHLSTCLKRADQFSQAMAMKAEPPEDTGVYLVCGNGIKTTRRAEVNVNTGELKIVEYGSGDGKVLTSSALWDERDTSRSKAHFMTSPIGYSQVILLRAAHMGITVAPGFEDNLLFLLSRKRAE